MACYIQCSYVLSLCHVAMFMQWPRDALFCGLVCMLARVVNDLFPLFSYVKVAGVPKAYKIL